MVFLGGVLLARTWTLVIGGDVMLNGIKPGSGPLAGIASATKSADFSLANLEVPLTNATSPTRLKTAAELKRRDQFVLKADPRHALALRNAGFDAVTLANNHAMDYGFAGIAETRRVLSRAHIDSAGAGATGQEAAQLVTIRGSDGFRIGLLGALAFVGRGALAKCGPAGPSHSGVHVLSFGGAIDDVAKAKLRRWIGSARRRCDYLVVAVHWGIERQAQPTTYQKALGRALVDAGADLVWGSHPHVLGPTETYRKGRILYSTGNLVSALPARTALFRLQIDRHRTLDLATTPATISAGKVRLPPPSERSPSPGRIIKPRGARIARP